MKFLISLEYVAGFFDADGYVGVVKSNTGYYNLRSTITNIDILVLQKIQSEFGGIIQAKSLSNPKWSHQYVLVWNGMYAKEFLQLIKNYSIVKKSQIEMALTFPLGTQAGKNPTRDVGKQDEIYNKLKAFKVPNRELSNVEFYNTRHARGL